MGNSNPIGLALKGLQYCEDLADLCAGNSVELLVNGAETFPAWIDAIRSATDRISMEMYIFKDDAIGEEISQELIKATRRGVQVRLIYDAVGCRNVPSAFFERMKTAGIHAIAYHPTRFWRPRMWTLLRRNHRKTLVCDGKVAFTGGVNIGAEWLPKDKGGSAWQDLSIAIRGPAVFEIEKIFLRTWNWRSKRRQRFHLPRRGTPLEIGEVPVAVIANRELVDRFAIRRAALHAIRASRNRVLLASPYFLPDPAFLRSLAQAAARGVDVRVLLPKHSDARIVDLAGRATLHRLLPHGVRAFLHHPLVHAKALVVDDWFVSIGSYNFDHRSLVYNLEIVVNVFDKAINQKAGSLLLEHMAEARELTWGEYRNRSIFAKFIESIAYAFRHWL